MPDMINEKKLKTLCVFGTRPEAIKMAPLIKEFQKRDQFQTKVCVTAQHREMLDQVLDFFEITPDYEIPVELRLYSVGKIPSSSLNTLLIYLGSE